MEPSLSPSLPAPPRPPAAADPLRLAALARQGSAAALRQLGGRCLAGPVADRVAALRLLPGLIPFQPVWPILERADRPGAPAPVRRAVERVRVLLDDPRECEAIYRAVQQSLVVGFVEAEQQRLRSAPRRRRAAERAQLQLLRRVATALYDYRFEMADGCLGDLRDRHVEEFLLEYAPRRLLLERRDRPQVPRALLRHVSWLARRGHLLPRRAQRLCLLSLKLGQRYLEAAQAPAQPGSPRAALQGAIAAGVDLGDAGALRRHLVLSGLDLHDEFSPVFLT